MKTIEEELANLYNELAKIQAQITFLESKSQNINDILFNYIVKIVCEKENITYNKLISSSKKQEYAFSRMIIAKLAHDFTGFNLSKLGKLLGNRHHSTIIYCIKTVNNSLDIKDNTFANYKYYEQNIRDYRDNLFNQKRNFDTKSVS